MPKPRARVYERHNGLVLYYVLGAKVYRVPTPQQGETFIFNSPSPIPKDWDSVFSPCRLVPVVGY